MSAPEKTALAVSSSPHAHSGASVRGIMMDVLVAMIPAGIAAFMFFGWNAIRLILVCSATSVLAEWATRRIMKREAAIDDLSAVVTGVLLAFNLPPSLPSWMAAVGAFAAVVIAKQVYGGLGYNVFNPALVGRTVLLISFPVAMTTWTMPSLYCAGMDAVTTATPLGAWKTAWSAGAAPEGFFAAFPLSGLVTGNRPGCLGETSAIALGLGAIYLLLRRCIYWHAPAGFFGAVAVISASLYALDPARNLPPAYHLLSGGLFLGAFFMATDMVTTPVTRSGQLIFGLGCGLLTMVIRRWGGYPEGVSFSILIMNSLTPLINRATRPRVFGTRSKLA